MTAALASLRVAGLRSLVDAELALGTDVTVLIGANGSGKSTLVSALELVSRIWDGSFQEYLEDRGGLERMLFAGDPPAQEVTIDLWAAKDHAGVRNGYRARLRPSPSGVARLQETLRLHDTRKYPKRSYDEELGWATSSQVVRLDQGDRAGRFASYVRPLLAGCRVFHFDDVSAQAPATRLSTVGDDVELRWNAENIAAYLLKVNLEHPQHYREIVAVVQQALPFFQDFVLVPDRSGQVRLRWRQRGLDRTFLPHEASDGALRFICLATLLLGPDLPATVVLDEPELGLHPAAIGLLAEMTRAAGRTGHRVIIATQSVPLLSHYEVGEIAVLEHHQSRTTLTRPDASRLEAFLDDYSTGSLWEMNLLGGRPGALE